MNPIYRTIITVAGVYEGKVIMKSFNPLDAANSDLSVKETARYIALLEEDYPGFTHRTIVTQSILL